MIAATLFGWAAVLALGAPGLLRRAGWPERAPRLGVLAWQAASASFVLALLMGSSALIMPFSVLAEGPTELLTHCLMLVRTMADSPYDAAAALAGATALFVVCARLVWAGARHWAGTVARRRAHAQTLVLLGRPRTDLGATVITHDSCAAYCLPGRRRFIVITTGALSALDETQVYAVLAHERAHLRARHHLAIFAAAVLHYALPGVPLLRAAADAIPRLLEMAADDSAGARSDRSRVASALVTLASATAPAGALAAGGPSAVARVRRLLAPSCPLPRAASAAAVLTVTLLLAAPVGLAAGAVAWTGSTPDCVPSATSNAALGATPSTAHAAYYGVS